MNVIPARCDKCNDIVLIRAGIPLATCKECRQPMDVELSVDNFEKYVKENKKNLENVIGGALLAFKEGNKQYAFYVLAKIYELFPDNEAVAYQVVKVSDFNRSNFLIYLKKFCNNPTKVPFAEDFLSACVNSKNIGEYALLEKYINSKLDGRRKELWLKKLADLKTVWIKTANSRGSFYSLVAIVVASIALNIAGFVGAFTFLKPLEFYVLFSIAIGVIAVEYGALYLHKVFYGNRTQITKVEKILSIILISSAFVFFTATIVIFLIGRFK